MYGDPHHLRALAHRLHLQADELRSASHGLERAARDVPWTGLAGDAMRVRVRAAAAAQRRVADLHDAAAAALREHAAEVERLVRLIARIEHDVTGAVQGARDRLHRLARGAADAVDPRDAVLAALRLPAPGSADWLHLRLP